MRIITLFIKNDSRKGTLVLSFFCEMKRYKIIFFILVGIFFLDKGIEMYKPSIRIRT